jgi:hypothetical protein
MWILVALGAIYPLTRMYLVVNILYMRVTYFMAPGCASLMDRFANS